MAWGAHAPSHVAVGAPADRFPRVTYSSYLLIQTEMERNARVLRLWHSLGATPARRQRLPERQPRCSAILKSCPVSTKFLPQRNAKSTKAGVCILHFLRSLRSFAAIHLWLPRQPPCGLASLRCQSQRHRGQELREKGIDRIKQRNQNGPLRDCNEISVTT
jgi:hypothetical protein